LLPVSILYVIANFTEISNKKQNQAKHTCLFQVVNVLRVRVLELGDLAGVARAEIMELRVAPLYLGGVRSPLRRGPLRRLAQLGFELGVVLLARSDLLGMCSLGCIW
jgi:hypothetical protein